MSVFSSKTIGSFSLACLLGTILLGSTTWAARGRPQIDASLGYNIILSDKQTLLRGVSISFDGGDPYGSLPVVVPTQSQLNALAKNYGLNALHLYLEGDSAGAEGNNNSIGYNAVACDTLVQRCADAGLYLIITIGCNGKNGQMNLEWSQRFWNFYGPRYKDQTHVIYEAHNEPAPNTLWNWTTNDWNNQVALYNTIRAAAPNTLILLCSFMGFAGANDLNSSSDPRNRANYLKNQGVNWSNAAIAHHGYESKIGVETAISLLKTSTTYPALLCTEFWPGDTTGQEYNSMYESHHNGWMQFQWLGANDNDLSGTDGFKQKIINAGTVWTPDDPDCSWPARATPLTIPTHNSTVGIYAYGSARFIRVNSSEDLVANLTNYSGNQNDKFTIERSGMNLISLKASNGLYVSSSSQTDSLSAVSSTVGAREKFQWIELANGAVVLRAYGSGGHLLRSANGTILPDADNGLATASQFFLVDGSVPSGQPPLPTSLPSPWQTADIGTVGVAGTVSYDNGLYTLAGSGADIEGAADAFRYVYQAANGDVTIVARVATQLNTDYWAKTGVMIRESTAAGSINAAVLVTPEGGVVFQRRSSTNGETANSRVQGLTAPHWVKLVRTGNRFSAYQSVDGVTWSQIDSNQTINMATSATVGLAVCSHKVDILGESTLDNVDLSGSSISAIAPAFNLAPGTYTSVQSVAISSGTSGASIRYTLDGTTPSETAGTLYSTPLTITASTTVKAVAYRSGLLVSPVTTGVYSLSLLPSNWQTVDIGNVGIPGSATYLNTTYTLKGSGADIWGTADGCHFLSQSISGDFVITARLTSMSNTDYWAKAGLMVRETNAANAKNVALLVTPESGGTRMQWRSTEGGNTSNHELSQSNVPLWLRLVRSGNTITGWQSDDGVSWIHKHSVANSMSSGVWVGLVVTSHQNDTLNTALFQNVDLVALPAGTSSWSSFQNRWFTASQITDASLSGPTADFNRDGHANLFSYGSGVSPLISTGGTSNLYPVILDAGGFLTITYPRLKNRLDFDFVVEVSSDLVTWNSGPAHTLETSVISLDTSREQVTVRDQASMNAYSRRFIRLKAIYGF